MSKELSQTPLLYYNVYEDGSTGPGYFTPETAAIHAPHDCSLPCVGMTVAKHFIETPESILKQYASKKDRR